MTALPCPGAGLFDTHAHLNDARFDPDRGALIARLKTLGLAGVVEIADAPREWDAAVALSRAHPDLLRCSLGLHPYHASAWKKELVAPLEELSRLPEVVAIGEIGLDYVKSQESPQAQRLAFEGMLDVAGRLGLPVVIHCRGAWSELMPLLRARFPSSPLSGAPRFRGVLHCFSGGLEDALEAVRLGFALGVDGPITYPKNDALRAAVAAAGLDSVVLETDSPYLPPQSARGSRNDPSFLPEIAAGVAALFGASLEETARRSTRNAKELYRLD